MFVGRKNELNQLVNCLNLDGLQTILIYGKRRIGKTELIEQSLNEIDAIKINYQCQRTNYQDNIDKLSDLISEKLGMHHLSFSKIEEVLSFLIEQARTKKIVLSFDEYPYLREIKSGIDDIFQNFIDHNKAANIKLIFCGSYANVMEKMISKESPLFQRFRSIILLKELPYYEILKLCPDSYSDEEKIKIYSVFGGVPYYYNFIDWKLSANQNIVNNILKINSSLVNEAEVCLNNQLMKINSANLIFQIISSGVINFNDIKNASNIDNPNNLDAPIKKLIEMELIEKRICINAEKNKKNRIYYSICDNFFGFYFRYVFKHFNKLKLMGEEKFFNYIKEDFETKYIPFVFEKICYQYIEYNVKETELFNFVELGSYYYDDPINKKTGQMDLVGKDSSDNFTFFEVKYTNKPIDLDIVNHLKVNIDHILNKPYKLGFASKSGFSDKADIIIENNDWFKISLENIMDLIKSV